LGELEEGKQKIDVSIKFAMCTTSGLRLSKKTFSDALPKGLSNDTHILIYFDI
jgi:hypothetical protein